MQYFFVLFIVLQFFHSADSQSLFINEIVASNQNGEMDDFFEFDDWIEIYNSGALVNLAGYYLSDDPLVLDKWLIPSTNPGITYVPHNDHIIFWIDKDPQQGEDHVDFSLSSDGETIFLVAPNGQTIVDSVSFPQTAPDISYGRTIDGSEEWTFFTTPTLDAPNAVLTQPTNLLFINEVQTINISTHHDQQFEFDQWVEIYNPNSFQVNLAGYSFHITGNEWMVPNLSPYWTVIPANGFATFWFDNDLMVESNHASFLLPTGGTTLFLTGPNQSTVDQFTYPAIAENKSFGRQSDGSPTGILFNVPTPRVSNTSLFIQPENVFINEIMAQNVLTITDNFDEFEDWIEIYNPGSTPVNLSGYFLSDNPGNPLKWEVPGTFPDSVSVPANGWLLFWADEDIDQGVLHTSFRLSNNSECISLYGPDGFSTVDEICWSGVDADSSYGRVSDGSPDWWLFTSSTPESSNNDGVLNVTGNNSSGIKMYPNPASSILHFNKTITCSLRSVDGRLIEHFVSVREIVLNGLAPGIYLITNDSGAVFRVIKE